MAPPEQSAETEPQEAGSLGPMIREARRKKGWTLEEASGAAGIGRSTLSKIENNQTKPSFDVVRRLTAALDLKTPQLFLPAGKSGVSGRRDVTRAGGGEPSETDTYAHELLCTDLTSKRMLPYISTIKARDLADFGSWVRHDGEEFMYVISGSLILHTEHYRPLEMAAGDSVYYDSAMGHCCVSTSPEDATVLWVSIE